MKHLCRRPNRILAVFVSLALLVWLVGCNGGQEDPSRPVTAADLYGTWMAGGLSFESAGKGTTPLTRDQLALFDQFKATSFTFNRDSTYVKRTLDSTSGLTTVEGGIYSLMNGQLVLTSQDEKTKMTRNQYYSCEYVKNTLGLIVVYTVSLQVTKARLLQALDEQKQANPLYGRTRDFLLERQVFKINQTLRQ